MAEGSRNSSRLLIWIAAIGALIAISVTVAVLLLIQGGGPGFSQNPEWMVVRLDELSEAPVTQGLLADPEDLPPLTSEMSLAIQTAADDEDIKGIFLDLKPASMGWAQAQEIRDALKTFTASGKPCIVWSEQLTNLDYYVATACDDIRLMPAGITLVNGLAITQTYYAETLSELNIEPNFLHVGDFKSAVEPYERTGPSAPAAEATNYLLDSLYTQLLTGISEGRTISMDAARDLVNDPPMAPDDALERGLVDALAYRDEVIDEIGEDRISSRRYIKNKRVGWASGDKKIAVIYASGTIMSGESGSSLFGGNAIGDQTVINQLNEARDDDEVAAIVLRVNSPGGSGSASDRMWRAIQLAKENKPFVVSMGDYAASGGYYMSMSADRIFAEPGTLTGSIGVFGGKLDLSGLYEENLKMSIVTFQRGDNAALLSSNHGFNEDGERIYKSFLEGFYTTFITKVGEGREMSVEDVHEVAQGRVWTGEQALERNLVDELGSVNDAIEYAAAQAAVEDYGILRIPQQKTFMETLLEELAEPSDDQARALVAELPAPMRDAFRMSAQLEWALGSEGPGAAAMLPFEITVR
ncbi:MAG: signal peptide peptidase SppA [Myxococcota bacterium]